MSDAPFTDAELRALRDRARQTDDAALARLVTEFITLRRLAGDAVALIETQFGGATVARAPSLLRLRELTRR